MDLNLSGRIAVVTGASRGIGRAIAQTLAAEGMKIAAVARSKDQLDDLAKSLSVECLAHQADLREPQAARVVVDATLARFGRIDLLVNNAGIAPAVRRDVLETTPESFDRLMAVNLRGAFFLTQKAARIMIDQAAAGPGRKPAIVFITSTSARVSSTSRAEYCISKAGLSMAARVYADRLAEYGINVYEIRPGIIRTDMTAPVREKYDALIAGGLLPQKRWGFPEDVGKAVAALARGAFPYSTGLILEVSGGMDIPRL